MEDVLQEISEGVEKRVLSLASGQSPNLLVSGGDVVDAEQAQESSLDLRERLTEHATKRFKSKVPELEQLAKKRVDVMENLLGITKWEYYPTEQEPYDKLLIVLERDGKIAGQFTYELVDEDTVNAIDGRRSFIDGLTLEQFRSDEVLASVREVLDSKTNVVLLSLSDELDYILQMSYVFQTHFSKLDE